MTCVASGLGRFPARTYDGLGLEIVNLKVGAANRAHDPIKDARPHETEASFRMKRGQLTTRLVLAVQATCATTISDDGSGEASDLDVLHSEDVPALA